MEPTKQVFAIIFGKVPPNYTVEHIISNHLCFKSGHKFERWKRAIRMIDIDDKKKECKVIFSSIFYWCKYSRNVLNKEKKLSVGIYPKYFQSILHPSNIDFVASNCNDQLIKLYSLPSSIVSYTFIYDNTINISTKLKSNQEFLIKIPSSIISNIKLLNSSPKNESDEKETGGFTDVILELNEACELYQYFHRHKLWICTECGGVNDAKIIKPNKNVLDVIPKNDEKEIKCICCNAKLGENNDYHLYDLNKMWEAFNLDHNSNKNHGLDLKKKRVSFVQQSLFYRKISSFNAAHAG